MAFLQAISKLVLEGTDMYSLIALNIYIYIEKCNELKRKLSKLRYNGRIMYITVPFPGNIRLLIFQ